jgi:hypothetical protein
VVTEVPSLIGRLVFTHQVVVAQSRGVRTSQQDLKPYAQVRHAYQSQCGTARPFGSSPVLLSFSLTAATLAVCSTALLNKNIARI